MTAYLLAQVVPPAPPVSGSPTWQFWVMAISLVITVLGQILAVLKSYQTDKKSKDALESAQSAESHARQTAHHVRDVPGMKAQLAELHKKIIKPQEDLIEQPNRPPIVGR